MDWDLFFELHKGLDREGPGEAADVHWVLSQVRTPARVLDAGCGPGADMLTFAKALPEAEILGMDKNFAAEASARIAEFAPRAVACDGDMANPPGAFDLIWCAGALYFLGVTEGLAGWRKALTPKGYIAFSEPVLLDDPSDGVAEFWAEYPAITDLAGIERRIIAAGFEPCAHRLIQGEPWANYYDPLQARINALRRTKPSTAMIEVLDINQREIDLWRANATEVAYALFLVRPLV